MAATTAPAYVQAFGSARVHISVETNGFGQYEPLCRGVASHKVIRVEAAAVNCPRCMKKIADHEGAAR